MRKDLGFIVGLSLFALPLTAQEWVVQTGLPGVVRFEATDDGRVMAAVSHKHSVGIWRHGRLRSTIQGDDITLSQDGSLALITDRQSQPQTVALWETAKARTRYELPFDGQVAATAWIDHRFAVLSDKGISIYASRTGELVRLIEITRPRGRFALLVSPKHDFIAFRSQGTVEAWSLTTDEKRLYKTCRFRRSPVETHAVLSGNGRILSAVCQGVQRPHSILVWDAATDTVQRFPTAEQAEWLDLDDRGRRMAASFGESVEVYELRPEPTTNQQGELVPIFSRQAGKGFTTLDLSPSGDRLLLHPTGWDYGHIALLEADHPRTDIAGGPILKQARFTSDERRVRGFSGQTLCHWLVTEVTTRKSKKSLHCAGTNSWPLGRRVEFTANGRHLVSAYRSYTRTWDLETGTSSAYRGRLFALSADGELMATGPRRGNVQVWRLADQKKLVELDQPKRISHFGASRNGRGFVTVAGKNLVVWDEHGNKLWETWERRDRYDHPLYDATLARLFVSQSGAMAGWDLGNDRVLPVTNTDGKGSAQIGWVPDSRYLWTAGHRPTFAFWDPETGALVKQASPPDIESFPATALDEDTWIVSTEGQTCLGLLSFSAPEKVECLHEHGSLVSAIEVSGDWVASTTAGQVKIWRARGQGAALDLPAAAREKQTAIPARHYGHVQDLAWDPQKRVLAAIDDGGVIWLWQTDGRLLARLLSPDDETWVLLAGDGRWQSSHSDPPGAVVWVDDRPLTLAQFSEPVENGLLVKLLAEVEQRFESTQVRKAPAE